MLREKIDACQGVVHLVGHCYGAEPPTPDEQFGRVSYTQYEALYARQKGRRSGIFSWTRVSRSTRTIRNRPSCANCRPPTARCLKVDTHLFHPLKSNEALEAGVLKLRDDLTQLRRGAKRWAIGVAALCSA